MNPSEMTAAERLNYAEMHLDEARRNGTEKEREYWRGYVAASKEFASVEAAVRSPGSKLYRSIIVSMVHHNMSVNAVAAELHYHHNTICYHCDQITRKFGLNPRNFFDLCQLVKFVKGGDIV